MACSIMGKALWVARGMCATEVTSENNVTSPASAHASSGKTSLYRKGLNDPGHE
jgi:hypothetical protein